MKKSLLALAAVTALSMSTGASAEFLDFTIDESSVPNITEDAYTTFTADKITGSYAEQLSLYGAGSGTFKSIAYANLGSFTANEGLLGLSTSWLNQPEGRNISGYGLYAVFSSEGSFSGSLFNGTVGAFDLYVDPDQNTTLLLSGLGITPTITVGGNDSDYKLASSTNFVTGAGTAGGSFKFQFTDFTLTTAGSDYFISPNPFHLNVNLTGDFDTLPENLEPIIFNNNVIGGTFKSTGDVSAVFVVPEPGSLALLGLGLAGLGFAQRRRNLAK